MGIFEKVGAFAFALSAIALVASPSSAWQADKNANGTWTVTCNDGTTINLNSEPDFGYAGCAKHNGVRVATSTPGPHIIRYDITKLGAVRVPLKAVPNSGGAYKSNAGNFGGIRLATPKPTPSHKP